MKVYNSGKLVQFDFESSVLTGEDIITEMRTRVDKMIEVLPQSNVVFNFLNVEHLSSAMLGELVLSQMKIRSHGGQVRLANLNKNVRESLTVSGLAGSFQICPTIRDAAASFEA